MRTLCRAAAAAALLLAAGCAPAPKAPEELVFWQTGAPAALDSLARNFEAANPGLRVRVERIEPGAMADSVAAALAAGRPPDLCELEGEALRALLAAGALSDWSAGAADQRDSLRGWDACRVGDALYGMPWRLSPRLLYWNRDLFARAGLDPDRAPATWDRLLAAAARLHRLRGGVRGIGLEATDSSASVPEFLTFAWGNGAELLSAAGDSARLDSREAREALDFVQRLARGALLADRAALDAEFAAGRLGLRIAGPGLAGRLAREAPALRFDVAPVPTREGGPGAPWAGVRVLASFARSRHKEHALRFARFLARPEHSLAAFAADPGGLPANAGADSLAWFRGRPRDARFAAEASRARFAPAHPAWPAMERALGAELAAALRGDVPAESSLVRAAARLAPLAQGR